MSGLTDVPKGTSFKFIFSRDGESLSGWVLTIEVKQHRGDTASISRVIEADGTDWPGYLTSTETAALTPNGTWTIYGVMTNASEDREQSPPIRFHLSDAV